MDLYPAIDIRDGGAVRLTQGDFGRQRVYGDPLDLARRLASGGAPWLHVVDLDAARRGKPANRPAVLAIAGAVDVPVQAGGGVRSEADVVELLEGGVARVVLGTVAVEDPELLAAVAARYPGRVAVGVDYRRSADGRTEVAVRGWEERGGQSVDDLLSRLDGVGAAAVIVTAIDRDGTLAGPDLDGLGAVLDATTIPVIASGGVGTVADLAALARLEAAGDPGGPGGRGPARRLLGAITGKALVDGRMTVEEAVAACARSV